MVVIVIRVCVSVCVEREREREGGRLVGYSNDYVRPDISLVAQQLISAFLNV